MTQIVDNADENANYCAFVIFGASGDLAKKKIYPALWRLFRDQLIPNKTRVIGYARSDIQFCDIENSFRSYLSLQEEEAVRYANFLAINSYYRGQYDDVANFQSFDEYITEMCCGRSNNRIFYFALPPTVFEVVSKHIKEICMAKGSDTWTRLIVEKPFGRDSESAESLTSFMASLFHETQLYRIDHYLGKEMVQNILAIRFMNHIFTPVWNKESVNNVLITFKEPFGTMGRGGYFDKFGIIRDIMQNHLMQLLCLIAMERPASMDADDIRDEKVKLLKQIKPVKIENLVVAQYRGNPNGLTDDSKLSYIDDPQVPNDSLTPTYACAVLYIDNERWNGVPFILRCGKALNERKAEVRMQLKSVSASMFGLDSIAQNELVMSVQPVESIYVKVMTKVPGMEFRCEETELDLTFRNRYKNAYVPDAYDRLITEVFTGSQMNFVRSDELLEAWRIFTPILNYLENKSIKPLYYEVGARNGPVEAMELMKSVGFTYSGKYKWPTT